MNHYKEFITIELLTTKEVFPSLQADIKKLLDTWNKKDRHGQIKEIKLTVNWETIYAIYRNPADYGPGQIFEKSRVYKKD